MVITGLATSTALTVIGVWLSLHVDKRLKTRGHLIMAAGTGIQLVIGVLTAHHIPAAINAAATAFHLYNWWNSGGGDGMRRLGKKLKDRLTLGSPVPQAA